ncbi:circularly permuted type 2 ATP-grasp protein [Pseudonocardia ailaonensis]|uniref:Circularly permuted type 2 ATP-grasp protein n=1 Tax=Pseudonocardia ailaonensis TaxID=367279 RepID=A0ABN2NSI2_9PSEU
MYDEMRDASGAVRPLWTGLAGVVDSAGPEGLAARRGATVRLLADDGVAYHPPGAESEQLWELDPLPLILSTDEWGALERGVAQRAELLDRLLVDLYGPRTVITGGVLPVEVVDGHPGYLHAWRRTEGEPATPTIGTAGDLLSRRELFLAAVDLGRSPDGWVVLDDRVQAPSGAGYAMANRRVVARVLSALHRRSRIRRLGPFFEALRAGLRTDEQRVVLLNPGPDSETAYEQALLSSLLGVPLVLGSELTVREGRVWQHTLGRLEPVDVVLRRLDAEWCDPLDLRPDSRLGVPGLVEAARTGAVSVLNGLGSGVAENPGLIPYLPALCRALLGEDLLLPGPPTWWCGDPLALSHVREHAAELVLGPIARGSADGPAGGSGSELRFPVRGGDLTAAQRAELLDRIAAEPHAWTAQREIPLSTAPTITPTGAAARPVVLRTFAVASGSGWEVLDGGLASVSAGPGVRPLEGAATLAKDVWVVGDRPERALPGPATEITAQVPAGGVSPRVAEDLFWLGRYAERAEDTARLLRAVTDRWADFQNTPEPAGADALRALLLATSEITRTQPGFADPDTLPDPPSPGREELRSLLCDRDRPGTLGFAVHRLTRAAQAVRELLPTDTWLVLGRLDTALARIAADPDLDDGAVSGGLNRILEGLLALAGIVTESLVRDAGWRLLDTGRRVERAQHVVALLAATLCAAPRGPADRLVVESVTIVAESVITHRRRHAGRPGVAPTLDLLLADRENPRAVAYQLDRLTDDLAHLPGPVPGSLDATVRRLAEADLPAVAARDAADGTRPGLAALLAGLTADLDRLAVDIGAAHFAPVLGPRPYDPLLPAAS